MRASKKLARSRTRVHRVKVVFCEELRLTRAAASHWNIAIAGRPRRVAKPPRKKCGANEMRGAVFIEVAHGRLGNIGVAIGFRLAGAVIQVPPPRAAADLATSAIFGSVAIR